MVRMSKYLTPGLRIEDLSRVVKILGLNAVEISWIEKFLSQPVYCQVWGEQGSRTVFLNALEETLSPSSDRLFGEITIEHRPRTPASNNLRSSRNVFEKILPFPYSFLFSEVNGRFGVSFHPKSFEQEIVLLQEQTKVLDQEMSRFEIAILWIKGQTDNFPLLFHFVRKKLVRVGTLPELSELVQKYQLKGLTPAYLREFFGTNAAFFALKTDKFSDLGNPLQDLALAIRELVNNPSNSVIGEPLVSLETPTPLEYGL